MKESNRWRVQSKSRRITLGLWHAYHKAKRSLVWSGYAWERNMQKKLQRYKTWLLANSYKQPRVDFDRAFAQLKTTKLAIPLVAQYK